MASIPCPSCETVHEIDQPLSSLDGKRVRCASCREVFVVRSDAPAPPENFDDIPAWEEADLSPAKSAPEPAPVMQAKPPKPSNTEFELEFKWDSPPPPPVKMEEEKAPPAPPHAMMEAAPPAQTSKGVEVSAPEPRRRSSAARKPAPPAKKPGGFSFPFLNKASAGDAAPRPPMRTMMMAAGIASLAAFGIARHEIVRLMPQTAPIFDAVGLSVNLHGIEFGEIRSRIVMEGDVETLEITGTITNITREVRRVPVLRLSIQNVNAQDVFVWTANAEKQELAPGEVHRFRRRLASPPPDAHHVMVRFVAKDDLVASIR